MGEWRRVRIGDVCDIIKGETGLASATPGQYPMVATGAERRSCNTYQFDTEAVCIPLVSSTGHGKKTLNYVHYQSGKFALGTILAAIIPKDPKVLTARYLHLYLSHFKDTVLVPLMKGAANVTLPLKGIASVEIPVPPVGQQQKLIDLIGSIESEHRELLAEGSRQTDLFKQLRQSVLQEAVEGKLTADWRTKNLPRPQGEDYDFLPHLQGEGRGGDGVKGDPNYDAAALLAQIKAEKERLVKAGKIRKEKPLPLIADGDKPFELPAGWVWCRLGEISYQSEAGKSLLCQPRPVDGAEWGILRVSAVSWGTFKEDENKFLTIDAPQKASEIQVKKGDFLISRANTKELIGRSVIVRTLSKNLLLSDKIVRFKFGNEILKEYVDLFNRTNSARDHFQVRATGSSPSMKNITREDMETLLMSLPPLAEQQAIVARIDSLMARIDELEQQVAERKEQAQMLMQAVLREAFAGGEGADASDSLPLQGGGQEGDGLEHCQPLRGRPIPTPTLPLKGRGRSRKSGGGEALPLVAEPPVSYNAEAQAALPVANQPVPGGIPARILAAMQPGREYSRADLLAVTGISEADWIWAIRQLKGQGRVVQKGEKRGARYARK